MKLTSILKIFAMALPLVLTSCKSHRQAVKEGTGTAAVKVDTLQKQAFLQKVNDNAQYARFITSKVRFTVEVGARQMTLTGNLKMKRDDVIRLQLMAFGFVEAGRLEFTKEYVLVMDRINKLFLKVPYAQVDFLRNCNIDFNVIQGLFWNELFQPRVSRPTDQQLKNYTMKAGSDDTIIAMEDGKLSYRWLADNTTARVKMANVMLSAIAVVFTAFIPLWSIQKITAGEKSIQFQSSERAHGLNPYMGAEEDWETRTEVSSKYRQVTIEEILQRFMSL